MVEPRSAGKGVDVAVGARGWGDGTRGRGRGARATAEEEDAYAEEEEADALLREIFEEAGVEATWMALGEDEDV